MNVIDRCSVPDSAESEKHKPQECHWLLIFCAGENGNNVSFVVIIL